MSAYQYESRTTHKCVVILFPVVRTKQYRPISNSRKKNNDQTMTLLHLEIGNCCKSVIFETGKNVQSFLRTKDHGQFNSAADLGVSTHL